MTTRRLTLTAERLRAYSRRGNFHSDPTEARALGLPGLVAQGMQVLGPAYGILLDEWGDAFLAGGTLDVRFVGMVTEGEEVEATVEIDGADAAIAVANLSADHTAVVGTAQRSAS
jgi:acyl dehydratase